MKIQDISEILYESIENIRQALFWLPNKTNMSSTINKEYNSKAYDLWIDQSENRNFPPYDITRKRFSKGYYETENPMNTKNGNRNNYP